MSARDACTSSISRTIWCGRKEAEDAYARRNESSEHGSRRSCHRTRRPPGGSSCRPTAPRAVGCRSCASAGAETAAPSKRWAAIALAARLASVVGRTTPCQSVGSQVDDADARTSSGPRAQRPLVLSGSRSQATAPRPWRAGSDPQLACAPSYQVVVRVEGGWHSILQRHARQPATCHQQRPEFGQRRQRDPHLPVDRLPEAASRPWSWRPRPGPRRTAAAWRASIASRNGPMSSMS